MSLRLLSDPWIPVRRDGAVVNIRPDQIAEPGIAALAWPRADFNLACLELLIGLVSMADPPKDETEWQERLEKPDAGQLRKALVPFEPSFVLGGDGPRFLQDIEPLEEEAKKSDFKPVDMLYIDSAGDQTKKQNADLMVKRDRFDSVSSAEAAMALYTLQAFAPSGGAGNRTSMRGGGPMTTLVHPLEKKDDPFPVWRLVFANVLPGSSLPATDVTEALPWLRPTLTSEKEGQVVTPEHTHRLEAFFGMPRRLRLRFNKAGWVDGVVQKKYGTNYAKWEHPLTPYYRQKEDSSEWLPVHPKAGRMSYRNWLGVTIPDQDSKGLGRTARVVRECRNRNHAPDFELLVGGWAMDNMKPVSFSLDRYPAFRDLDEERVERVHRLVEAAKSASNTLRKALKACQLGGKSTDMVIEAFFTETEAAFETSVQEIIRDTGTEVEAKWHGILKNVATRMFDEGVLDNFADCNITMIEKRITEKRKLLKNLGKEIRNKLELPMPDKKESRT